MSTATVRQGRHLQMASDGEFRVRVLGPDGPPSLVLRLPGRPDTDEPSSGAASSGAASSGGGALAAGGRAPAADGRAPAADGRAPAADGRAPAGYSVEGYPLGDDPGMGYALQGHPIGWGTDPDPLHGDELWRAIGPTTVLAGLRDTASASSLLSMLDFGRLTGLRLRMSTSRPALRRRDRRSDRARVFGTVCALSTLLCWPERARTDLTVGAARAATAALQQRRVTGHAEAALALRWVVALAEAFPQDPMVLAPLLLKLRWFEGGQEFLVPARWPSALLSGDAVAVSGAGSVEFGGGLGAADPDPAAFVAALEPPEQEHLPEPAEDVLSRALQAVRGPMPRPCDQPA